MKSKQKSRRKRFCPGLKTIFLLCIVFMLAISFNNSVDFMTSFQIGKLITATKYNNYLMSDKILKYNNQTATYTNDIRHATWAPVKKENGSQTGSRAALLDRSQKNLILNEKLCSNLDDLFIVVLVHSAVDHFERRTFIRRTWGNISMFEFHRFRIVFILGKPDKETYQIAINLENNQYGDIVQGTFLDTYRNLTHKALLGLRWVTENCKQAHFVLKVDDDVVINTPSLVKLLTNKYTRVNRTIYCAEVRPKGKSFIHRGGKYKVEKTQFPYMTRWPVKYCPGRFLLYTSDIIEHLLGAVNQAPFLWLDDVYVTGLLAAKVGHVNHLKAEDISKQVVWMENANTTRLLSTWDRFVRE